MKAKLARLASMSARLAVAAGAVAAGGAHATGLDLTSVTAGIDSSTVVTAIVAAGAIFALPGFAKWAVKKVAGFFG